MHRKTILQWLLLLLLIAGILNPAAVVQSHPQDHKPARYQEVSAYELIIAMNQLRSSYGLSALVEDPIINAVAQSTAEIMAANQMSWHIGDVSGRLTSAGYGGGSKVWATENFAVGNHSIDEIMVVWSDESHMIPAVNPAYCHVGAGVAKSSNGMTYYVLQAAYTAGKSCGPYKYPDGATAQPGGTKVAGEPVSQIIIPVKVATPDADGKIFHVVQAGQSFWAIAVTYQITIKDIETWNNLSKDSKLQIGQKLFIPSSNTKGYATPTPVGMIQVSTPDKDGKIVHSVQSYQTLSTISQVYDVKIDTILSLNGIQADWPLQIGQKLLISPGAITPSATQRPLTEIEKLTPASDGKYYHTIKSGETLSWIADLYKINVMDLMSWNALNSASILQPQQKLVLQVTPPATITPTPAPPTITPTITVAPPSSTPTTTPAPSELPTVATAVSPAASQKTSIVLWGLVGLGAVGLLLVLFSARRR